MLNVRRAAWGLLFAVFLTSAWAVSATTGMASSPLPGAGTDTLQVSGHVSVTSRIGQESISLTGTATISRAAPHTKGSVEANDMELVSLNLSGTSLTGPVTVTENGPQVSDGELESQSDGSFPASSFFNVYAIVTVPAAPSPSITLHNDVALVMSTADAGTWPPAHLTYSALPNPCILLEPSSSNPAQICITSASFELNDPSVGGMTELADAGTESESAAGNSAVQHGFGAAIGALLLATVLVAGWYARAKLRSDR